LAASREPKPASPAPSISDEGYEHFCTTVADCALVHTGTVDCCDPGCLNAAVGQTALPAFMRDLAKLVKVACGGADPNSLSVCHGANQGPTPVDGCQQARVDCSDRNCVLAGVDAAMGD
jgi:hypothetical protein